MFHKYDYYMNFCIIIGYQTKKSQMQTANSTSAFKSKQLFIKKNIVVKFIPTNSFKKGFVRNRGIETTISVSIPTIIINTILAE